MSQHYAAMFSVVTGYVYLVVAEEYSLPAYGMVVVFLIAFGLWFLSPLQNSSYFIEEDERGESE